MTFRDAVYIFANGLSLSIAVGLIFVTLIQPRRTRLNGWFALFLASLGVWAYFSMARAVPEISPFDPTQNFYLLFTGLTLTPISLYWFVVTLTKPRGLLARALTIWALIMLIGMSILLWTDQAVHYHQEVDELGFELLFPAYIVLGHVVVYSLLSLRYLRTSTNPHAFPLQLPVVLLLLGYTVNLAEPFRRTPIDIILTTIAASIIGYSVLRWQLFNPLREINDQLRQANTELRLAISDLAAEKARAERLNDDLREASRYKSSFLANMSHELRTPLNSIVGYSELLLKNIYGPLGDTQEDRIEKVHRNGLNLLALINDILDLSKIEGGRLELNLGTVRLSAMVDGLISTVEPMALEKGLRLEVDLDSPLRLIHADELRIRQIFLNLLGNAVKFTPSGYVRLRAQNVVVQGGQSPDFPLPVIGWLEDRAWILVSVEDSGIGIPPEEQASIFDEFRQVDSTTARQYEGAGLGLAIAKKLVELHTGRIWVRSQSESGSTFYVALPALDTFDVTPPRTTPPLHANTLLLVEDNDEKAGIVIDSLQAGNYNVVRVNDASSGLARVHDVRPAAILVDILMPQMAGWNTICQFKQDPAASELPLMALAVIDNRPSGFWMGRSVCISKPIQHDELLTALASVQHHQIKLPALIIDSDPADLEDLCQFLTGEQMPLAQCDSGPAALTWLHDPDNQPGLVLVDMQMSGFEVLYYLRSKPEFADVPIVILSADHLADTERTALNMHISGVLSTNHESTTDLLSHLAALG